LPRGDSQPMRYLFVHQNFPGQFRHVARALASRSGNEVLALTDEKNRQTLEGVPIARYKTPPAPPESLTASAATIVSRFTRGEAVARAMISLRERGATPDLVVGHPGWGELLLAREIFPSTPIVAHAEYYYRAEGGDVGFDPEFPGLSDGLRARLKAKNLPLLSALADATHAISPTAWQAACCPEAYRDDIEIIHEGIRTDLVTPKADAVFAVGDAGPLRFAAADEVLTFVNRNLEPLRGYHVFMRALPAILKARPEAHAVIVGGDRVSYGAPSPDGRSWKDVFLTEVRDRLPMDRVHFVGQLAYADFVSLMQVTRLHVYATYPFVLSWSMLEAMSAGALVLGSATAPVTEIIEHGRNGFLYEFFDGDALARQAIDALAHPERYAGVRAEARRTIVEAYDLQRICLPAWLDCLEDVATNGRRTRRPR